MSIGDETCCCSTESFLITLCAFCVYIYTHYAVQPTLQAFRNLFRNLGIGGCEDLDTESLTAVLLYHIVAGEALKDDLKDGDEIKTLGGSSVHVEFRRKRRNLLVNDVRVSDSDIIAADGIIHKINEVLLPE